MFWATTGRPPDELYHSSHGWSTANFPIPWHPSRGRSRPPGQPSASSRQPACQPVPNACLLGCSPHHPFTVGAGTSRLREVGWLEHTYPLLLQLPPPTPPSDIFDAFHPTATRCPHVAAPIRIDTRRQQLQLPAPTPSTGTIFLLVLTRLTWPRDWFEHLAERGARESTASTRLRRRP